MLSKCLTFGLKAFGKSSNSVHLKLKSSKVATPKGVGSIKKTGLPTPMSQQKRRVTFGRQLTPEIFDYRRPPQTPISRGATPRGHEKSARRSIIKVNISIIWNNFSSIYEYFTIKSFLWFVWSDFVELSLMLKLCQQTKIMCTSGVFLGHKFKNCTIRNWKYTVNCKILFFRRPRSNMFAKKVSRNLWSNLISTISKRRLHRRKNLRRKLSE